MTSNRARPEQGDTASNVGFMKMISMAAFDLPLRPVGPSQVNGSSGAFSGHSCRGIILGFRE